MAAGGRRRARARRLRREIRVIRLTYLPDLEVGDWTIVHAGFALTKLDAQEAGETLALLRDVGLLPAPAEPATT
ncbi:HypC/HybG/HupF family hydrogenase formation chaperone [Lapillicoccus sp.]|uniref:HypC/HybG/HupF family hydrogenase formation chaperone n=1 Tax=Lapillicoccus sp. TaxID=1909287 RepID=UPI0025F6704D|nr:HypC/HybG/HupF family hydrogenase formation chaperone [Lapillicoccus sp.]